MYLQFQEINEKKSLRNRLHIFPKDSEDFFTDLEQRLFTLGKIWSGGQLILGGSLGRGEPCIRPIDTKYVLFSDLDLIHISNSTFTPPMLEKLRLRCSSTIEEEISMFALTTEEYSRLQTSIGWDLKFRGINLTSPFKSISEDFFSITPRDATDVFVFALQEFFERGIAQISMDTNISDEYSLYSLHRISMNALRSVIMLEKWNDYHDIIKSKLLSQDTIAFTYRQLEWRCGKTSNDIKPTFTDCIRTLIEATTIHEHYGHFLLASNTVDNSEYAATQNAEYIRNVQEIVLDLWRAMFKKITNPLEWSPQRVFNEQISIWLVLRKKHKIIQQISDPYNWFLDIAKPYRQALLAMKVESR